MITAEEIGVYKPRLRAFAYTLDKLGVAPDEIVHVSASPSRRGPAVPRARPASP
ncbi:hypothetical protein [Streptomyces sp. D2-8]|uniref:hypothetical protein n=1 Tax=Streptomyces sp. D2-8 TaxID=2707767 RepID=UPI0020BEDD4E|nr:hypothetical protein [Streptomyces sp. D2-8]